MSVQCVNVNIVVDVSRRKTMSSQYFNLQLETNYAQYYYNGRKKKKKYINYSRE